MTSVRSARMQSATGVPFVGAVADSELEAIVARWNKYDSVQAALRAHGVGKLKLPNDIEEGPPTFSSDMLDGAPALLGKYMADFTVWLNYLTGYRAQLNSQFNQIDNTLSQLESACRQAIKKVHPKMSLTDIDDHIKLNPQYEEINIMRQMVKDEMGQLDAAIAGVDRAYKVLSRNVELVKLEVHQHIRDNNVGNMRRGDGR